MKLIRKLWFGGETHDTIPPGDIERIRRSGSWKTDFCDYMLYGLYSLRRMFRIGIISIAVAILCSLLISLTSIIGSCRRYPRHHDIIHPVASADLKTK